jgi:hypothetical protein
MSKTFKGQCQCGDVQYVVQGRPLTLFACHCKDCQRQSSSAFGMAFWIADAVLELPHGRLQKWVRTMPSGRQMECSFCPVCGTRLFHRILGQDAILSIKPGTLNDARGLTPVAHIWTASAQSWLQLDGNDLQYPHNPDDFQTLFVAWAELHP